MLDTGVDVSEDIDIAGRINLVPGEEEVSPMFEDVSGHGTAVASVIAAKENDIGVTGINPNVELYSVKALDDAKQAPLSRIIEGLHWCMENDIDIINMSFGTPVYSEIFQQVISDAYAQGILLIAAAGNRGNTSGDNIEFPAAFPEVIAVGATDTQGELSEMSSAGTELELLAPGERIPAIGFLDYIVCTEGTSMSAPHVTGAASVLWAKDTSKTNTFIRNLLNVSANHISDNGSGSSGIVDLDYALSVYDEFAANYTDDASMPDIMENPSDVKSYDDAVVEACWKKSAHQSMLDNDPSVSANVLKIIQIGAKLPDDLLVYDPQADLYVNNHSFHGGRNYIANYIFMRKIARKCYDEGWSAALTYYGKESNITKYSDHFTQSGFRQIINGLHILDNQWSSILTESGTNTKENQARVLVGMAVHLATDAYAHKSWGINGDGTVYQIPSWLDNRDPRDDPNYIPQRFKVAKQTARDIVKVWHEATGPSAKEFYHPNVYGAIDFKMLHYASNLQITDPNYYSTHAAWFEARTVETN